jgi:hypothetical protein
MEAAELSASTATHPIPLSPSVVAAKAPRCTSRGAFYFPNSRVVCCIARPAIRKSKVGEPTYAVLVSVRAATLRTIEGDW